MTGENLSIFLANIEFIFWLVRSPVGGEEMGLTGWMGGIVILNPLRFSLYSRT